MGTIIPLWLRCIRVRVRVHGVWMAGRVLYRFSVCSNLVLGYVVLLRWRERLEAIRCCVYVTSRGLRSGHRMIGESEIKVGPLADDPYLSLLRAFMLCHY